VILIDATETTIERTKKTKTLMLVDTQDIKGSRNIIRKHSCQKRKPRKRLCQSKIKSRIKTLPVKGCFVKILLLDFVTGKHFTHDFQKRSIIGSKK